jgi:hypothetical protein
MLMYRIIIMIDCIIDNMKIIIIMIIIIMKRIIINKIMVIILIKYNRIDL